MTERGQLATEAQRNDMDLLVDRLEELKADQQLEPFKDDNMVISSFEVQSVDGGFDAQEKLVYSILRRIYHLLFRDFFLHRFGVRGQFQGRKRQSKRAICTKMRLHWRFLFLETWIFVFEIQQTLVSSLIFAQGFALYGKVREKSQRRVSP